MHFRRLSCFLLGCWLAGGVFMAAVATENFASVDRLLERPSYPALEMIHRTGRADVRMLLRYQVAEQNRWYFERWEYAQFLIGTALLFFLLFGSTETKSRLLAVVAMLLVLAVQRFYLTPEITSRGRLIDFVPAGVESAARTRFWTLHGFYSGLELVKWGIGLYLISRLILRSRPRLTGVRKQVHAVDKADHGHIDG